MPHLFVNRHRHYDFTAAEPDLRRTVWWETLNAYAYKLGGLVFIVGSIMFFPALDDYADLGAYTFLLGSLIYLVVTGHDMLEVIHHARRKKQSSAAWDRLEFWAATSYVGGTVLFTVGSVFFLHRVGLEELGAWCFVIGSLLFVAGAAVNVVQIVKAQGVVTMQLMNLTAVTFVTGAVLFTVASIPYLWRIENEADQTLVYRFLAAQYLVGSVLFLAGGVFNYRRARIVIDRQIREARGESGDGRGTNPRAA